MREKLTLIKNIAWALSIGLVLLALVIALLIAAFPRGGIELDRPAILLGADEPAQDDAEAAPTAAPVTRVQAQTGTLITLAETPDAGEDYIASLTFLCDSAVGGLQGYGLLPDGNATTQVWISPSGSLPVNNLANCVIRFPNDGSQITPGQAAMIRKPDILVIAVGQDGLKETDEDTFLRNYETMIASIRENSPSTIIVCCSITSVGPLYSGPDTLDNDTISWGNDWVQRVCKDTGAYFCDVARSMRDNTNVLDADYASANLKTLNAAGLEAWLAYLRTHAVQ